MKGFLVGVLSAILICSTAAFVQSVPPTLPPKLVELNNRISWHDIDDGTGNLVRTLRFNGINIQITNGLGTTASFNSAGNLIVGYNEIGNPTGDFLARHI
jgi:opacity protein-like surface antigen